MGQEDSPVQCRLQHQLVPEGQSELRRIRRDGGLERDSDLSAGNRLPFEARILAGSRAERARAMQQLVALGSQLVHEDYQKAFEGDNALLINPGACPHVFPTDGERSGGASNRTQDLTPARCGALLAGDALSSIWGQPQKARLRRAGAAAQPAAQRPCPRLSAHYAAQPAPRRLVHDRRAQLLGRPRLPPRGPSSRLYVRQRRRLAPYRRLRGCFPMRVQRDAVRPTRARAQEHAPGNARLVIATY